MSFYSICFSYAFNDLFDKGLLTAFSRVLYVLLDAISLFHPYSAGLFAAFVLLAVFAPGKKATVAIALACIGSVALMLFVPDRIGVCFSTKLAYDSGLAMLPVVLGLTAGFSCRIWWSMTPSSSIDLLSIGIAVLGTTPLAVRWSPWIDLFANG